MILCDIFNQCI